MASNGKLSSTSTATDEQVQKSHFLVGTCVYLSGPMGFVASRANEMEHGWRSRVSQFLKEKIGVTVLDPWCKPVLRGLEDCATEDITEIRKLWSFESSDTGEDLRAQCAAAFSLTKKTDLRMVDKCDFIVACCPTNIYSVGTVHEIIRCREQSKPVLFVSPHIDFPAYNSLYEHLEQQGDEKGRELLKQLAEQIPIKPNQDGIPSAWYMASIDGTMFFDGFGFAEYRDAFGWKKGLMDELEEQYPPRRPLFPYLANLSSNDLKRWDLKSKQYVVNDDWLIW